MDYIKLQNDISIMEEELRTIRANLRNLPLLDSVDHINALLNTMIDVRIKNIKLAVQAKCLQQGAEG